MSINFYKRTRHTVKVYLNFLLNRHLARKAVAQLKGKQKKIILVNLLEHLGDIVACEPVSRYLRQRDPGAYIVWGVKRAYKELIDSNPNIDMTLVVHCLTERLLLGESV